MAVSIPLASIPNQRLSVMIEGRRYEISVIVAGQSVAVSIACDGDVICSNARAVPNIPILTYDYQQALAFGNFAFLSESGEYPDWRTLADNDAFIFVPASEL